MIYSKNVRKAGTAILIVPGLHGSEAQHWQSLWQQELPECVRVEQANWHTPDLPVWSAQVIATAQPLERFWIVAHSFGVLASLHALPGIIDRVAGVFLVAPADPDKFAVRNLLPHFQQPLYGALVASHTDPWMSMEKAVDLAGNYGLPLLDAGAAGHINIQSGHGKWRQGLEWFGRLYNNRQLPDDCMNAVFSGMISD